MNESRLREFTQDTTLKDSVHEALMLMLEGETIKRVFAGNDTGGIKDAKDIIDKCFRNLDEQFPA